MFQKESVSILQSTHKPPVECKGDHEHDSLFQTQIFKQKTLCQKIFFDANAFFGDFIQIPI